MRRLAWPRPRVLPPLVRARAHRVVFTTFTIASMAPKLKELKPGKEMDGAVIKRLHQILKNADLEKTTVKNIQKQLEVDLEISLSDRKAFIREEVSPPNASTTPQSSIPARSRVSCPLTDAAPSPFSALRLAVREVISRRGNGFFSI